MIDPVSQNPTARELVDTVNEVIAEVNEVIAEVNAGGIPEAPINGQQYGRKDAGWVVVAGLDSTGKVPASQLPSYVDDVLMYANLAAFPVSGATGVIYVAEDTGVCYRWTGVSYIKISDDDVLEFANLAAFPASGSGATLYIAADTGLVYRWNGSTYLTVVGGSGGSGGTSNRQFNILYLKV